MAQIKVYGHEEHLNQVKQTLSDIIHACVVDTLRIPADKRFHRFFPLQPSDFVHTSGRSDRYTIIEVSIFEGRSIATKKALIKALFERMEAQLGIPSGDIEITIFETPKHNWGIRGAPGDELELNYDVSI